MFQNYEYFLTLAETLNMSSAAQKLFISHQCLSRYLKTLESECGVTLFERRPSLRLTPAGEILRRSFHELQRIERDTRSALNDCKNADAGEVRFGLTEGRLRIFLPRLLKAFHAEYPDVSVKAVSASTPEMLRLLAENKLDIVLGSASTKAFPELEEKLVLEEDLYLVVSDRLLARCFPGRFPQCKEKLAAGADLRDFLSLPFCAAHKGFHSRTIIDNFLKEEGFSLNIIYESEQHDLLQILAANDYACSFCLSMYLPSIKSLNQSAPNDNRLNVFPIRGLREKNPICLFTAKSRYLSRSAKALLAMIREQCRTEYHI